MHDFRAKLSDPRTAGAVEKYLEGVRARRAAAGEVCGGNGMPQGPISINLDLTLACDYRCAHCIDGELLNGGLHIPLETLLGTLQQLAGAGLRSVILIGGGEPTLHPFFEDVVRAIKDLELQCAISSNGAHNDRIARVVERLDPHDWVRLSLDAGTEETFQALHQPRKAITLKRICATAAALKDKNPRLQMGFSFIVMWSSPGQAVRPPVTNVQEMAAAAELAKKHRFDYISFKPLLIRDANRSEVVNVGDSDGRGADLGAIQEIRLALHAAQSLAGAGFRVVPSKNLLALLEGSARERSALQPHECHMQQFRQVISPAGIFACPAHRGNERARVAEAAGYAQASALEQTSRATQIQIQRFDAAVECRDITCIYNDANWWLEELVESGEPIRRIPTADFFL